MYRQYTSQGKVTAKYGQLNLKKSVEQHSVSIDHRSSASAIIRKVAQTQTFDRVSAEELPEETEAGAIKVFLSSDAGAGLSSLLHRLIYQRFGQEHPTKSNSTICLRQRNAESVYLQLEFVAE